MNEQMATRSSNYIRNNIVNRIRQRDIQLCAIYYHHTCATFRANLFLKFICFATETKLATMNWAEHKNHLNLKFIDIHYKDIATGNKRFYCSSIFKCCWIKRLNRFSMRFPLSVFHFTKCHLPWIAYDTNKEHRFVVCDTHGAGPRTESMDFNLIAVFFLWGFVT